MKFNSKSFLGNLKEIYFRLFNIRPAEIEYVQFYEGDKLGMIAIPGKVIIPPIYDMVSPLSDGLFQVTDGKLNAYFDTKGTILLPFESRYDSYGNFTEGVARVRVDDKWGFIDKKGKEVITPQFYFVEEFSNGLAIVRNDDDKHGAINLHGELVVDFLFKTLLSFENGYAKFGDLKTWGLINKKGEIVVPQEYYHVGKINNNTVEIKVKEGEYFREGTLTIGGEVEWNSKSDALNKDIRDRKLFQQYSDDLIAELYGNGCPCEYPRFRNFIEWEQKPISFIDQYYLFGAFTKFLDKLGSNEFQCKACGTIYVSSWEEYSISLAVESVKISKLGTISEIGAELQKTIPVKFGFKGFDTDHLRKKYIVSEMETVFEYLREIK